MIKQNPDNICPQDIFDRQKLLEVQYYSFDDELHDGQIIVHEELARDVTDLFTLVKDTKFPITSVIPISEFDWDDDLSMDADNTSGFNYRTVSGTNRLSNHAYGRAIDINPRLNPYFTEGRVSPQDATYDPSKRGTITADSEITLFLKERGWEWGGDWDTPKDYQHFQKPI